MLNPESSLQSILKPELSQTITTLAHQEGQTMLEWVERILREAVVRIHSQPSDHEHKVSEALNTLERLRQQKDFWAFSKAGRELAQWHLNYETIAPYPLPETIEARASLNVRPDLGGLEDLRGLKSHTFHHD